MESSDSRITTIDAYISSAPEAFREKLQQIREAVQQAVPEATEAISYGMPAFRLGTVLLQFAPGKTYIGVYPTASPLEATLPEVAKYRTGKGTLQFPLDQPLPLDLIRQIAARRAQEVREKQAQRKNT